VIPLLVVSTTSFAMVCAAALMPGLALGGNGITRICGIALV